MTLWNGVVSFIEHNPAIAIFFCLGLGYLLGKFHIKSFKLGSTVGVLIVALIVGQFFHLQIPNVVKNIFFDLFIFTIGYEVGPSFVHSFKKNGWKLIIQGVFFSVVAFVVAFGLFKCFHIGPGEGSGIVAGALTQSAVVGTAASSINMLHISAAAKTLLNSKVAIAYAITYVFGTVGVVIFIKNIAPWLLRVNLRDETKKAIEAIHYREDKGEQAISNIAMRYFSIKKMSSLVDSTVDHFEKKYPSLVIEQVIRNKQTMELSGKTVLQAGDVIALIGRDDDFATDDPELGIQEVVAPDNSVSLTKKTIRLTKAYQPLMLKEIADKGMMVTDATRQNQTVDDLSQVAAGDDLTLIGTPRAMDKVVHTMGYVRDDGTETDVSYLSMGIVIGILIGSIIISIKAVPITLGTGGGSLFAGLFFGWWQDKHPNMGHIPASVRWLLKSLGLNLFIGCVGLTAGAAFIPAIKQMGWLVFVLGMVISIVPFLATLYFGRFVLKLNTVDNIGSLCGSGTITAALNAVTEEQGSSIFAIGYTPTYAVGNILITVMGPLLVALL